MKKFIAKIVGIATAFAMVVGVGVAVANNKEAKPVGAAEGTTLYTGTFTNLTAYSYTTNKSLTISNNNISGSFTISSSQENGNVFYLGCNSNNAARGVLAGTGNDNPSKNNDTWSGIIAGIKSQSSRYNDNYSTDHAYAMMMDNEFENVGNITISWSGGGNNASLYLFAFYNSDWNLIKKEDGVAFATSTAGSFTYSNTDAGGLSFSKLCFVVRPGASATTNATNKTYKITTWVIKEGKPAADPSKTVQADSVTIKSGSTTISGTYEPNAPYYLGETLDLTASTVNYHTGDDFQDGSGVINWSSSDENVATISDGVVTFVKAGTTTITGTADDKGAGNTDVAASFILDIANIGGGENNPYTVEQARGAIDANRGLEDAYVKGVVFRVQTFGESDKWITYWISDNGSDSVPFEIYHGYGIGGANFSALTDIKAGDIVVVKGNLTKYSSTYELAANSQLVSQIHVASIAVKTAPTKVAYNNSECFDPSGLVVTATYDDTPNPTIMDFSYADLEGATYSTFSFNPSTSTALTDEESVSITLFGKTTSQAITITTRAVTGVTIMGDMTNKSYTNSDDWDLTGIYLSVAWNIGSPNPTTVNLTDLTKGVDYELDKDSPSLGDTSLYIYGAYEGFDFEKTVTGITVTKSPAIYTVTSKTTVSTGGIVPAGTSASFSQTYGTVSQATAENSLTLEISGFTKTTLITGITLSMHSNTKASSSYGNLHYSVDGGADTYLVGDADTGIRFDEWGDNTELTSSYKDVVIGTDLNIEVSDSFTLIIFCTTNSLYCNGYTIDYIDDAQEIIENSLTQTMLSYRYESDGGTGFTVEDISIRFGAVISKNLWNDLDTGGHLISGFGVMITEQNLALKDHAGEAVSSANSPNISTQIVDYYMPLTSRMPPEDGNNYAWNLFHRVDWANRNVQYYAAAYIKVGDDYVFFGQEHYSVTSLAANYLSSRGYESSEAGGSLSWISTQTA